MERRFHMTSVSLQQVMLRFNAYNLSLHFCLICIGLSVSHNLLILITKATSGGVGCFSKIVLWEKGRDLTQSYDRSPYTHRKIQKATRQHKNATKSLDYTTIADRLSWGNDSHPTGVVKPVYRIPTFPLSAKSVQSKRRRTNSQLKRINLNLWYEFDYDWKFGHVKHLIKGKKLTNNNYRKLWIMLNLILLIPGGQPRSLPVFDKASKEVRDRTVLFRKVILVVMYSIVKF